MLKDKIRLIATGVAATAALALGPLVASAAQGDGNSNAHNKVTVCHATGSTSNPFVKVTANANGNVSGHEGHQDGRDIIPPFTYNDHGSNASFPGQNWDAAGQATFNNNCVVPAGGQGGSVLGSSTTAGRGAGAQGSAAPAGSVSAGFGGASDYNPAAVAGLGASIVTLLSGAAWLNRRKALGL